MRRGIIATAAAVTALALAACSGPSTGTGTSTAATSSAPKTLTLAPITDALPWDIAESGLGNNTLYYQAPYDSLLRLDPTGKVIANLVTEWKYTDEGNTVLALTLRDDVTFTDGEKFDAAAVKANFEHNATGANEVAGQLKVIKSTEVVDATHVTVTLSAPDPSFVYNIGSGAGNMASPKAIKEGTLKDGPVGSGPYVMDKAATTAASVYTFVRNEKYWNKEAFPFDKVVFKPMTDPTAMLNALRAGQIDGGLLTTPKNIAPAKAGGLNILEYAPGDVNGVYIWDREGKICKPLADVKVRQAINYSFDRETIIAKAFQGMGTSTLQVFNPSSTAFDAALNSTYSYDPAKAKALLAEAGYANGFSCDTIDLSSYFPEAQAAMIEQLKAVGITLTAKQVPAAQVITDLLAAKFPISFFALASFRSWDTVTIQLKKDSLWNLFKVDDPKVSELVAKAQVASEDEAPAIYKELNTYITQQAWNAPWSVVKNAYAYSKNVTVVAQEYTPVPFLYNFAPAK